ncbi:Dipeptide-binding ABC transporter, periplasmic substrate-binding component (TC 3.A.1.5.2) [Halorubrum sp. DM2]|uniref:ABC transporter substrate-binding protein n=1 Tax=Halorubrum sp. DM2 TaxID=2527867 RepID=UPI0024B658FC|nr:ABC transporter substrate-binding protein [Halorubrum sp. DM2]VTT85708.1 Dipeptide-binding ABC transporter, periplasmic substrate-binding component (TC 3.A.1.5.2) [Halorubrum sp. DM2]
MSENIDRRKFLAGVGTVSSVAVAGCSGEEDPVEESGADGNGSDADGDGQDQLNAGQLQLIQNPRATLDPIGISGGINAWMSSQVHEQPFTYADGTAPVESMLVDEYTVSDDYLTYTFTFKEGVSFHNGRELTASDAVYSWRRLAESENNRNNQDRIVRGPMSVAHETNEDGETVPGSLALEAVDEYTVEMTLEEPFQNTLGNLADLRFTVIPEGIVGDIEGYDGEVPYDEWSTERLTGTGPFQFVRWDPGNEIVVERFDDYRGSVANIDGIRWQILEDPNARYTRAVNEQNVDIFNMPRSQFDPALLEVDQEIDEDRSQGTYGPVGGETLNYGETSLPRTQYLIFNTLRVEEPARKAIAYIVNQEQITETAVRGQGEPAYFLTPPSAFPGGASNYRQTAQEDYPYGYAESDLDAARQVMEEAGYTADDPYETTLQFPSDRQASEWGEIANLLRDQAEAVHIDLEIEQAPIATLTNRAIEGDITIYAVWNELSWLEADSMLRFAYPNEFAWSRWGAEAEYEYDQLSDAAQRATDAWGRYEENRVPSEDAQETRDDAYLEIERANWADMTMLPLWHPVEELYWYDWVEGLEMHGSQRRPQLNEISLNR